MKRPIKPPNYLTKFPISIREKKFPTTNRYTGNKTHFKEKECTDFNKRWGYFMVNKRNQVNFIITLTDSKKEKNYTIRVSKYYILESLKMFLLHRPVRKNNKVIKNFFTRDNIKPLISERAMNDLTPDEIKSRYKSVKERLGDFIKESPNKDLQRRAELQLERLIEQEWKIELLSEIHFSEKMLEIDEVD